MITFDEILAWTVAEIVTQVEKFKPVASTFIYGYSNESQLWHVCFEQEGEILWDDVHPDERIALLNAFGWVWAKQQPQPKEGSIWHRRQELTPESVTKAARNRAIRPAVSPATRSRIEEDPQTSDLDPSEILQTVYSRARSR